MIYEIKNCVVSPSVKDGTYRIKKFIEGRSVEQNRYYWGVVLTEISEYTGHTSDELHEYFKKEYLIEKSTFIETYKSTTDLDIGEFIEYIERIKNWALTYNILIPESKIN